MAADTTGITAEDLPTEAVYRLPPDSAYAQAMRTRQTVLIDNCDLPSSLSDPSVKKSQSRLDRRSGPLRVTPLVARSTVLGVVVYARYQGREPFDDQDVTLGEELAARAAISIDNARLYQREHATLMARQTALREANEAREQLALINEAGTRIGTTLDLAAHRRGAGRGGDPALRRLRHRRPAGLRAARRRAAPARATTSRWCCARWRSARRTGTG